MADFGSERPDHIYHLWVDDKRPTYRLARSLLSRLIFFVHHPDHQAISLQMMQRAAKVAQEDSDDIR